MAKKQKQNKIRGFIQTTLKKMSWLDLFFIVLGFVGVAVFYLYFRRETTYITARFKVTDENPLYAYNLPNNEYASSFTVGDKETDELGREVAEVVGVDSYTLYTNRNVVYLDVRLKTTYNPRKNTYVFKGKQVIFGQSFTFSFSKVRAKALVIDFPGFDDTAEEEFVTVNAQLRNESRDFSDTYGIEKYVADAIQPGDAVRDSQGNIIAEVLSISTEPAERWIFSETGRVARIKDPKLVDVYMKMEKT